LYRVFSPAAKRRREMPYIEDLQRFKFRHEVELAYSQDLPNTINAIAVGWLSRTIPRSGAVNSHVIDAIKHFSEYHYVDEGPLGYQTCEVCNELNARGELLIPIGDKSYVLPQMVLHYMNVHKYRPPYEFIHDLGVFWSSSEASACRKNACGAEYHQPFHEEFNKKELRKRDRREQKKQS
jgi:hypothetical protein